MTDPIDDIHAESTFLRAAIRQHVHQLRVQKAMWQPAPMPSEWDEPPPPHPIKFTRRTP